MVNRIQALVLGFFLLAWVSLIVILAAAPEVYDHRLRSLPGAGRRSRCWIRRGLAVFLAVLSIGVLRRWRWAFWLILVAFLFGVIRVPVAVFELSGWMTRDDPAWYVCLQALIGVVQVLIAMAMLTAYRRFGVWGA
jgi:hypothetical protein